MKRLVLALAGLTASFGVAGLVGAAPASAAPICTQSNTPGYLFVEVCVGGQLLVPGTEPYSVGSNCVGTVCTPPEAGSVPIYTTHYVYGDCSADLFTCNF